MILSNEQIKFYKNNGYLILDNFFPITELTEFRNALIHIVKLNLEKASKLHQELIPADFLGKELDDGIIKLEEIDHQYVANVYDTIFQTPQFLRITAKKEIGQCINQLLSRDIDKPTYIDQSRCRIDPPLDPNKRTCGWHQEVFYYVPKSNFLQTWGPLIYNATKENGTVEVCPGSHNEGIAKQSNIEEDVLYKFIVDETVIEKYQPISVEMKLGQLLIFDSKLIHKSGRNTSKQVRYSLVGINHNLDNEHFIPPKLIVERKEEKMTEYYSKVFKKEK